MSNRYWIIAIAAVLGANAAAPAAASEMVYHPVNPTFGGNPLNGSFLLSTAQAQGTGTKSGAQSPDLSGLNNALSTLGQGAVGIGGTGNNGTGTNNNSGATTP